jgi:creatine kinase
MPPVCSSAERRAVELSVVSALLKLDCEFVGTYLPLAGSSSFSPKPSGMSLEEEEHLRRNHFLFQQPISHFMQSSGMSRDWPDARGIFLSKSMDFMVWVNEEDHIRIISMATGSNMKTVAQRFASGIRKIEEMLHTEGYNFMYSDDLGYINVCPSNLGTALRASVLIRLPLLSAKPNFKILCKDLRLDVRGVDGENSESTGGVWDISNASRLGQSEVDLVKHVIKNCAHLIRLEQALESG